MSKTVDFIFDFGSPNAYLAWKALPAIAARGPFPAAHSRAWPREKVSGCL